MDPVIPPKRTGGKSGTMTGRCKVAPGGEPSWNLCQENRHTWPSANSGQWSGANSTTPPREFFEIEPYQAEAILQAWPGENVTPQVNAESDDLDPSDRAAANRFKRRRPNLNFIEMGIQVGATLVSTATDEVAEVTGERQVIFRGEEVSLTAATRAALDLPPDQQGISPARHWTFEGRILREVYNETYGPRE